VLYDHRSGTYEGVDFSARDNRSNGNLANDNNDDSVFMRLERTRLPEKESEIQRVSEPVI
jgi:hypothetical protein